METGKLSHNFKHLEFMKPMNTIDNLMKSMKVSWSVVEWLSEKYTRPSVSRAVIRDSLG